MIDTHTYIARVFYDDGRPTAIQPFNAEENPLWYFDHPIGTAFGSHIEMWWLCPKYGAVMMFPECDREALEEMMKLHDRSEPRYRLVQFQGQPGIQCAKCGRTSFNPNDIAQKYCGHCHEFLEDRTA